MKRKSDSKERRREAEDLFAIAFKSNQQPIILSTFADGRILEINPAFLRAIGYSRDEVLGQRATDLLWVSPDDRRAALHGLRENGSVSNLEVTFRTKAGAPLVMLLSAVTIDYAGEACLLTTASDITERKRAERIQSATYRISEAAREAENLQALFRSIHTIIAELMPAENFYIALYDPVREELSFPYFADQQEAPPATRRLRRGLTEYVIRTGQPLHTPPAVLDTLVAQADVELIGPASVDWLGVPLKIKEKAIGALVVQSYTEGVTFGKMETEMLSFVSTQVAMAIDHRRTSDENLRMLSLLTATLESTADGILVTDERGGYVSFNRKCAEMWRIPDEIIEAHNEEAALAIALAQLEEPDEFLRLVRELYAQSDSESHHTLRFKDGRIFDRYSQPQRIAGESVGRVWSFRDVTERYHAEEELRASEEKYRELVENIHDVFYTCDLHGIVTYISPSVQEYVGLAPEDFVGRPFRDFIYPADLPMVEQSFRDVLAGETRPLEYRIVGQEGELRWVRSSSRPIISGGQTVGLRGVVADFTERKRAEEALRDSEARYRTMLDAAQEGIWAIDPEARGTYLNQRMALMLGYSVEEMLGRSVFEFMHEADHEVARAEFAILADGVRAQHDYRFHHKDGSKIWTICSTSPVFDDQGKFTGALAMVADITDRKRAEQQRDELFAREKAARIEAEHIGQLYAKLFDREQAARGEAERARREWQTTFDTMTDHVLLVDREDCLVRANRAFFEALHLTPENSLGRPVAEIIHADGARDFPGHVCPVCRLRRKAERAFIELPAGAVSAYPIAVSIDPITDEDGITTGVVVVARDLTELYRAREEAERERASLNATIEQMAEGLMVFDHEASVIRANRQARAMFWLTTEFQSDGVIRPPSRGEFSDEEGKVLPLADLPVQRALRELKVVEARLWYTRADDKRLFLSVSASPLFSDQNQLVGAIALLRDITEQQREYERSQQADKLRALGQLASGVAHNFNNALAAVLGYTQLSLPKVRGTEVEKYLRVVEQSAKDAARMVERIQNFSRARSRADDFMPVRVSDVVRDAVDITRPRWRHDAEALGFKYDVRLEWDTDEDTLVHGEPSELREVFVNIIFNALDAMPVGGVLGIRATADERHVVVNFDDTGAGMTEEIRQRIFEPFFTTKGVAGLGMGLSETYRIIERHGGRIDVKSQPRVGTTFTITLPIAQLMHLESVGAPALSARGGAAILVIDDEEYVRNVLAAILRELGYNITVAASAEEALPLVRQQDFAVVFTDLAMPKIDGIAAASEIRALQPRTKIVLMSGYGAEKASERAGDSSCIDAAINKPFRIVEIQNALRAVLIDS